MIVSTWAGKADNCMAKFRIDLFHLISVKYLFSTMSNDFNYLEQGCIAKRSIDGKENIFLIK